MKSWNGIIYWGKIWFAQLRISQYSKNLFLLIPVFFAGKIFAPEVLLQCGKGFFCFCICSSFFYALNDSLDKDEDILDKNKSKRPIASGLLNPVTVLLTTGLLSLFTLSFSIYFLSPEFNFFLLIYIALNLVYNLLKIRNCPPWDILFISSGFVCRVCGGGAVTEISVSSWLIVMTILLTLILALGKRNSENKNSDFYSEKFILAMLSAFSAVLFALYIIYIITLPDYKEMYSKWNCLTVFPVAGGILYYASRIFSDQRTNTDPSYLLFHDKKFFVWVIFWLISVTVVIYAKKIGV